MTAWCVDKRFCKERGCLFLSGVFMALTEDAPTLKCHMVKRCPNPYEIRALEVSPGAFPEPDTAGMVVIFATLIVTEAKNNSC